MKVLLTFLFAACVSLGVSAQQNPNYSTVKNGTKEQITERANEAALQAAIYLLATPPTGNKDVKDASQYLLMRMAATADYSFDLDNAGVHLYGGDRALLPRLLAAMAEFAIKNPENKNDKQKVRFNAARKLIA